MQRARIVLGPLRSVLIEHATHPGPTHWTANGTVGMDSTRQRIRTISRGRLTSETSEERQARLQVFTAG